MHYIKSTIDVEFGNIRWYK